MLVSTIIPTFNRARDVVVAIDSARAQTHADQEILVVDDGSTDGTAAALRARYAADPRVRVHEKPNGGVSSARNAGIELARGDALAFLDSDDDWRPEKLAAQAAVLDTRPEIGLVVTDFVELDRDRRELGVVHRRDSIPRDGAVLSYLLAHPSLVPSTALVRASIARRLGGFDPTLRTAEDLDFHLRLALDHQIAVLDRPLTRCMRGHDGLSGLRRTYDDYLHVITRFLEAHPDRIAEPERKRALFEAYTRNARGLLHAGDLGGAMRLSARSLPNITRAIDVGALAAFCGGVMRNVLGRARRRMNAK